MPNSRLPHKPPLIFVGELLTQSESEVTFRSRFPFEPTLGMLCEVAAQGSSYFPLSPHCTIGVVSSFRNIVLKSPLTTKQPLITITLLHSFNDSYLFGFRAFEDSTTFSTGEIAMFYSAG